MSDRFRDQPPKIYVILDKDRMVAIPTGRLVGGVEAAGPCFYLRPSAFLIGLFHRGGALLGEASRRGGCTRRQGRFRRLLCLMDGGHGGDMLEEA